MTYSCKYKNNPSFPYTKTTNHQTHNKKAENPYVSSFSASSLLNSILSPIEDIIGRKIEFDDLLLLGIIYIIFSEKNKENNTLLLCLLFILIN